MRRESRSAQTERRCGDKMAAAVPKVRIVYDQEGRAPAAQTPTESERKE